MKYAQLSAVLFIWGKIPQFKTKIMADTHMPELFKYTFHLKHDDGMVRIITKDTNIRAAMHNVLEAEGAPERAIHKIIIEPAKIKE